MAAFDSNDAFAASFTTLIEPWLRENAHMATFDFDQLHYALDGLEYLLTADRSGIGPPKPSTAAHVKCSMHDCGVTSAIPDACLLNFAPRGDPPLWFCRNHHPRLDGLPAAGWTPSLSATRDRALATIAAWNKLSPAERPLLNRNIVTVASGGGE